MQRMFRLRCWRHNASEADILKHAEEAGLDARAVLPLKFNPEFEASLFHHPSQKYLHNREIAWACDLSLPTKPHWVLCTIQFNRDDAEPYGDVFVISRKLAHRLGYADVRGNLVHSQYRPVTTCSSAHRKIAKFKVSVAGVEIERPAYVKDLKNESDEHVIVAPDSVLTELAGIKGLRHID